MISRSWAETKIIMFACYFHAKHAYSLLKAMRPVKQAAAPQPRRQLATECMHGRAPLSRFLQHAIKIQNQISICSVALSESARLLSYMHNDNCLW